MSIRPISRRGASAFKRFEFTGYRNESFAHRLGHNMGSHHDRRNSQEPGLYPYSHGFQSFDRQPYFRDIMAYDCSNGLLCPTAPYFSSPDILVSGRPIGVASDMPEWRMHASPSSTPQPPSQISVIVSTAVATQ